MTLPMYQLDLPKRFFITGTDTDIGKTVVSAILMAGLKAAYWKPIQSGIEGITDTGWIKNVTGLPDSLFIPETYLLSQPLSPHASAEHDGIQIDLNEFCLPDNEKYPQLIVEGAGGVLVPLNDNQFMVDLMKYLNLPVLLVAKSTIGTINHTLLSIELLRRYGLEVLGVVMNGPQNSINKHAIETYGHVNVIAEVHQLPQINFLALVEAYIRYFTQ